MKGGGAYRRASWGRTTKKLSYINPRCRVCGRNDTYVVNDVEVGNIVEEEATLPAQEVPVDGSSSSTLEVPFLAAVVGERGVSVMKVGDHDDCSQVPMTHQTRVRRTNSKHTPVGDAEPGNGVVLKDFSSAPNRRRVSDAPNHSGDTDVRHDDGIALGLGEEDGVGLEGLVSR